MDKVFKLIKKEEERQKRGIELIPSENYVSSAVLGAMGSVLTNKYSEGYPGNRYYGGNEVVDEIELLCQERALKLFGLDSAEWHVNVQPYSGSPANLAVYLALAEVGDTVMGLSLAGGGHLTHGAKPSSSGRLFDSVQYGVNGEGWIDYDEVAKLAKKAKPKMIWSGTTSYSRTLEFDKFRKIADSVGAYLVADIAHIAGLVVAGEHPSPFEYADVVTTTTHKTLRGPRGAMIFCKKGLAKDIDRAVFPLLQGGPHNHTTAAIAIALEEAMAGEFKEYIKQVVKNSKAFAGAVQDLGYPVVTGGTDNHLFMIDLTDSGVTGSQMQEACEKADISLNKTVVVSKEEVSWKDGNGIRVGTPAVTTRGMKEKEMLAISGFLDEIIKAIGAGKEVGSIKEKVNDFALEFPVPGNV